MTFDRVKVAEQTGKEAEERLLLEVGSEFFVRVGEDKYDDRKYFGHVVDLCFVVVGARRIGVVLDHEDDQLCESVDRLEDASRWRATCSLVLDVALDGDFGADTEEEGGDLLAFEDALILKLNNEIHERLLDRERLLVKSNPLGETVGELLSTGCFVSCFAGRDRSRLSRDSLVLRDLL